MRYTADKLHIPELVINWHLTEACNYRCTFCYAKWETDNLHRELIHDTANSTKLLTDLYQFFRPNNHGNPLASKMTWDSVRLNLAGGEPLLYPEKFISIVDKAHKLGFEVSLITNASQLNRALLNQLAPHLCWLGISLDSVNPDTNTAIGRISKDGRMIDVDQLAQDIQAIRHNFPSLRLKINTVINRLNHLEYLGDMISRFSPDKWKVLQVLPLIDRSLSITSEQFKGFIARHKTHSDVLFHEDNHDMSESYLMIDPHGRFYQNHQGKQQGGYCYSQNILMAGVPAAFSEMEFDVERFTRRYMRNLNGEVA